MVEVTMCGPWGGRPPSPIRGAGCAKRNALRTMCEESGGGTVPAESAPVMHLCAASRSKSELEESSARADNMLETEG